MWKISSILIALLACAAVVSVAQAMAQANTSWTVIFDDPGSGGTQTTTITISYTDSQGVKQEKAISAETGITAADSAASKKDKVQGSLNGELSKPANMVGGQALASTSGGGGTMTVTPSANSGSASDVKIESVKTEDADTGEKDKVIKPSGKPGLAQVLPEGELLGHNRSGGPSIFSVDTNFGMATVALSGSMTKLQLLKSLRDQLRALDRSVVAWIDYDALALFVMLDDEFDGVYAIGAGSTDEGVRAICKVMTTE